MSVSIQGSGRGCGRIGDVSVYSAETSPRLTLPINLDHCLAHPQLAPFLFLP